MINYDYASRTKRLLNWIIDTLTILILWVALLFLVVRLIPILGITDWLETGKKYDLSLSFFILFLLYYIIFEGIFKTSIGKIITRTRIIRLNGNRIRFYDAIIRTLSRLIPFEQFSFLSENPVGLHDSYSNTRIINQKTRVSVE